MKKVFLFLTSALVIAAVSCSKPAANNSGNNNTPGGEQNNGGEQNGGEEGEEEDLITIDGKFDDWAKASGAKTVSLLDANKGIVIDGNNQRIDALKTAKAVADGNYVYVYLECDMSVEYEGGTSWDGSILGKANAGPLDIYFDADCGVTTNEEDVEVPTGGIYWTFSPVGWEYCYESATLFTTEGACDDHKFERFTGENQTDVWAVSPKATEDVMRDGLVQAFTAKDGNIVKAELSFVRTFMPLVTGNKLGIGFVCQSTNWTLHGLLPQVACEAGAFTAGEVLVIDLPAAE